MGNYAESKPRFDPIKVFKSYLTWVLAVITFLGFILSNQNLTLWLSIIIVLGVIAVAYLVYFGTYAVRYLKYLRRREKDYNRLIELYGENESKLSDMKKEVSSFREQQVANFVFGAMRGIKAKSNESLVELVDEDIDIMGKRYDSSGLELIFNKGSEAGIEEGMLFSILTLYGDLWGVVEISHVNEDNCKGYPVSRLNSNFWSKIERDAVHDQTPPQSVKARLYCEEHLMTELKLMIGKVEGD